jgi:hypothetical protein
MSEYDELAMTTISPRVDSFLLGQTHCNYLQTNYSHLEH